MLRTRLLGSSALVFAVLMASVAFGADVELAALPFDAEHWQLGRARALEVDGRSAVAGTAFATGIELGNGILEVDIKVPSKEMRSYPGFIFRMKSPTDAERVYLRPHRAPLYDDAVQYSAVFNGIAGWQLYAGEGATASTTIPIGEWFTLRLEISGDRARVLLDGQPVLDVANLRHGKRSGGVGLIGPGDGSAVFSDFRWAAADDLDLGYAAPVLDPPGVLSSWQLSNAIAFADIDPNRLPDLGAIEWTAVESEPSGLVDIARYVAPAVPGPPTVIARTTLHAEEARTMVLQLGYSDRVTVFLDGTPVFRAVSDYRSRDSDSRAGLIYRIGADDQPEKWLQLEAGLNPNGVCIDGGKLFVGLNPVHRLIAVDLEDRSIEDHAVLPSGLVDGIEALGDGELAVSQAEGRLLRVAADGRVDALIDASGLDHPFADFDIAKEVGLILVPTYYTGHVVAYSLPPG